MATGRFAPSLGQVLLEGRLTTNANQQDLYGSLRMGVCLQTDSLFDHLTAREHLELFIQIRPELFRLSKKQVNCLIDTWVRDMNLTPHADRLVKTYSGGNKRKLCVALAMLENKLVFLDEPSSGMDPDARRALWNVIVKAKSKNDSSIVLTTHSMDEAEAVCDRIVIMVSGRLKALGTTQSLKSRFGYGYRLNLKYQGTKDNGDLSGIHNFIKKTFPSSKLLESLPTNCTYELGPIPSLSSAFRDLEELKQQFGIREFVITQNSLEQVFMHLVKEAQFEEGG
jgi:ABC-type multidrug transport system ATPase subunit